MTGPTCQINKTVNLSHLLSHAAKV